MLRGHWYIPKVDATIDPVATHDLDAGGQRLSTPRACRVEVDGHVGGVPGRGRTDQREPVEVVGYGLERSSSTTYSRGSTSQ